MKRFVRRHLPWHRRTVAAEDRLGSPRVVRAESGSWVARSLSAGLGLADERLFDLILKRRRLAQKLGPQRLWQGYAAAELEGYPLDTGPNATRSPEQVAIPHAIGRFFTQVVLERAPGLIVEIGTGFGGSGMYWLAGLEINRFGHLLTFEPNGAWASIAGDNLAAVGTRFEVVEGAFEDNVGAVDAYTTGIEIAFIDAIHTGEVVRRQLDLLKSRSARNALILLDDIDFSPDMLACWDDLKADDEYAAAAEIGRVGLIELRGEAERPRPARRSSAARRRAQPACRSRRANLG